MQNMSVKYDLYDRGKYPLISFVKKRYCYYCDRKTIHKPQLGFWSWLCIVLTLGLWFLVVKLFYRNRCSGCGMTRKQANKIAFPAEYWAPAILLLSLLFFIIALWAALP